MTTSDWAIPQQAKLKYTQLFNLHDRSRSGFLSGIQCRDILTQSGLPRNVLAEIWNLSDIDGDGQLTREEFILAMHLTNQVRLGNQLPTELAPELIPPSYRKPRSTSSTSIHSTGSITSPNHASGGIAIPGVSPSVPQSAAPKPPEPINSTLNSATFEDKRRENFEKGRAELERRRLKMIESQIGVLSEQLVAGKNQVAEAKSKIDAMRSDRDTKAGMITSLEAQLQTVQDRKAFLQHEEQELIAIAKDLNLVNSVHSSELDQQACLVKRESIKQMKEKLIEIQKEKEENEKELDTLTHQHDDSKNEFKTLAEQAGKVFQNYKEKLAQAETMRQQIIEENKSKPVDLDAAWDSSPSGFGAAIAPKVTTEISQAVFPAADAFASNAVASEDPWAGALPETTGQQSKKSTDQLALNFLESTINNTLGTRKSNNNNNNSSEINQARDYSAFAEFNHQKASSPGELEAATLPPKKMYRALFAFEARNADELTINPGDMIVGSDMVCEPDWLFGEMGGKSGLFPENYVELMQEEEEVPPPAPVSSNEFKLSATMNTSPSAAGTAQQQSSTQTIIKFKAIYPFEARGVDELSINAGDIITGVEGEHEPDWLLGELRGQIGLFPESYVEKLAEDVLTPEQQQQKSTDQMTGKLRRGSSSGSLRSKKSRSKKAEVATVIANYRALGQEQLNLEKGQLVMIRRKIDSGWWEGELQIKGKKKQIGWFPSSYVKLL